MSAYAQLHRQSPERELYVLHTDRETLDIYERRWLGIRGAEPIKASALEVPIESR